jgi:HSP20 family protein
LFDDFFASPLGLAPLAGWSEMLSPFSPNIDVTETDDEIAVTAELPGMDEEDIEILLDRNALVISGEKKSEVEEKGRRYYHLERSDGAFRRPIPLPQEVDQEKVEASFKKGVLRVTLPKTVSDKERVKRVQLQRS